MLTRSIGQGVVICLAALTVGTVHALIHPVELMPSNAVPTPVAPNPTPSGQSGGGTATPTPPIPVGGTPAQAQPAQPAPVQHTPASGNDRMISLVRFKELMAGSLPLQIIDAREAGEFADGHIGGAINIPPGEFFGKVPDVVNQRLSRDLPVVVYCGGGNCDASKLVAVRLKDLGFAQTYVYEDGYTGWTKAGEAVEK